jgi:PilZ domain
MKWFLNQNTRIQGPYQENELQFAMQNISSDIDLCFVWARGLTDWLPAKNWKPGIMALNNVALDKITITDNGFQKKPNVKSPTASTTPVQPSAPKVPSNKSGPSKIFKVQYDFVEQKPMNLEELIEFTRTREDINRIAIYDSEAKNWHEIYAVIEVADALGLSRRKNVRIPILAQFSGQSAKGKKMNSRVITISIGGMGITDTYDLSIGEEIRGQISSPHFFSPLNVEAEVTFCGNDGYIGLRFTQINDDTRALITEYINRFEPS